MAQVIKIVQNKKEFSEKSNNIVTVIFSPTTTSNSLAEKLAQGAFGSIKDYTLSFDLEKHFREMVAENGYFDRMSAYNEFCELVRVGEEMPEVKCYDIPVSEISDFKGVVFERNGNPHTIKTYHLAFIGTREAAVNYAKSGLAKGLSTGRLRPLQDIETVANTSIDNIFLSKINDYIEALPFNRKPQSLYQPIRYVLSIGGKRIRPALALLAYNLFKDDPESILAPACGLETYHNYTLLHDDLMDNAELRRGRPTVHKRWDANTAILSGDSMLVLAYQLVAQCDAAKLKPVMELFTETALEIGEGQQYDMDFEHRNDVTEDEYIEMIRLKTSVLLACAMKMGALLADAPQRDADLLYKFGEQIGLAFQLQDDFLDVYGDSKVFGKAIGGDIVSNKKTYMLINAFNKADAAQRAELQHWVSQEQCNAQEKIAAITQLYNAMGIDKMAERRIEHYFECGKRYLDEVNVPAERKENLINYASKMMNRKY